MDIFEGRISSSGFSSGDRIVIGDWHQSPLGEFTNLMWARPDGTRILLAPSQEHADYVSALYMFEEVRIETIMVQREERTVRVKAGELDVMMEWGRGWSIPLPRPRWFIATIEQFFANLIFGTKTHGKTCNGLREWYCVRGIATIQQASAVYASENFGESCDFNTTACFGFSEPPTKPSSVKVRSMIESKDERRV